MGDLVLIRHGETEWSRDRKHTGRTDLPLTPRGEDQARSLAPLLSSRRIGRVLVSPLQRALRTARLAGLPRLELEPDLQEWDYGGYEGLTTAHIHRSRPGWSLWTDGVAPGSADLPGESPAQVADRCDRVLAGLQPALEDPAVADVVLVAHGHVLRVLAARRLGLPAGAGSLLRLDTATLSCIGTERGRPVISLWNLPPGTPERPRTGSEDRLPRARPTLQEAPS